MIRGTTLLPIAVYSNRLSLTRVTSADVLRYQSNICRIHGDGSGVNFKYSSEPEGTCSRWSPLSVGK